MSKEWNKLSDKEKTPYGKMAEDDKVRYKKEMLNYKPPSDSSEDESDDGKKRPAKRQKRDPNQPKRGANAYMFFQSDVREQVKKEFPLLKMTDIAKKIGEKWHAMAPEEKKPYEEKAAADKVRYEKAMEKYKSEKS